jgi:hypothetical protein
MSVLARFWIKKRGFLVVVRLASSGRALSGPTMGVRHLDRPIKRVFLFLED